MISADYAPAAYTGNASTTAFATGFKFAAAADLVVKVAGVTKTLTTDYTVTGAGVDAGGTVTFLAAPASGAAVAISRVTPRTQPVSFITQGSYAVATHEGALDRTEMQVQELATRTITVEAGTFTGGITAGGAIHSTSGGVTFPDGTTQTTAGVTGSGTLNRVAIWNGTSVLSGTGSFTSDLGGAVGVASLTATGQIAGNTMRVTSAPGNFLDANGAARVSVATGASLVNTYTSPQTGTGVAHQSDTSAALADGGTIHAFSVQGTVKASFLGSGKLTQAFTDSSGTPGAATINKPSGKSAIASGATSVVITNSLVTAASEVIITPLDIDANAAKWKAVPASGSFTVTVNTATAAAWKFSWWVLN